MTFFVIRAGASADPRQGGAGDPVFGDVGGFAAQDSPVL